MSLRISFPERVFGMSVTILTFFGRDLADVGVDGLRDCGRYLLAATLIPSSIRPSTRR